MAYSEEAKKLAKTILNDLGHPEYERGEYDDTHTRNGHQKAPPPDPRNDFPAPIPASRLQHGQAARWLWHGYLTRGGITLYSALWKAGKTTLLAHLLLALQKGGTFCGRQLDPGRCLYVTEEPEGRWAERRDELGLKDHVEFLVRPFSRQADWLGWQEFLDYLSRLCTERSIDLLILDTLTDCWPVRDENDASQVMRAIKPLHALPDSLSVLPVHHHRKSDGDQATAPRGSGALHGFVDTIVEFRRYAPSDLEDRRRVLTAVGRWEETPRELVVELGDTGYTAHGSRSDLAGRELAGELDLILPMGPPGLTIDEIYEAWPDDSKPRRKRMLDALRAGADGGRWNRGGAGTRGSPYRFWLPIP